uniref:NADH-ubiquinone oxidoreductase chain 2 n=1 Tax=Destinoides conspicuus TaxID=3137869 RepID=A0AAU6PBY7_9HEMI
MLLNSSKFFFLSFMIVGIMISLSCNSWIMIWSGMELFLLSFIPFFCNYSFVSSESSMSYFLVQSLSSSLFVFCMIYMLMYDFFLMKSFLVFSLLLKLGCAPIHSWIMGVVTGMDYYSLYIFFSFAKLPPFFLLSYISYNFSFFVMMSLFFGSVGGLNHSSMKKLLGFSSVFNMGFLLYLVGLSSLWIVYFLFYCLMLFFLIIFLGLYSFLYLNQLFLMGVGILSKVSFWVLFLSLGGIPPLMGFFVKLIAIELSILNCDYLISSFFIFSSLVVIFYYVRCSMVSMIMGSMIIKWNFSVFYFWLNLYSFMSFFFFPFYFLVSGLF